MEFLSYREYLESKINEELSFSDLPKPDKFKRISKYAYVFYVDNNKISVAFDENAANIDGIDVTHTERAYTVNDKFTMDKDVHNPKRVLDGVNYCTELYISEMRSDEILVIKHIETSKNLKDKNKRAEYNKLYLTPLTDKYGLVYKLIYNTNPKFKNNMAYSFIYKNTEENELKIDKLIREDLRPKKKDISNRDIYKDLKLLKIDDILNDKFDVIRSEEDEDF
jgi:hypothetical protein